MKTRPVYLRDQATILADMEARLRDTSNARWVDAEIYRALNDAVSLWWGRVLVPHVYTGISSWTAGTYSYSLPDYVTPPLVPQMEIVASGYPELSYVDGSAETWQDIAGFTVEPNSTGGYDLRFNVPPYSVDARVLYYGKNGQVPTTVPTVNANIDATATSLVLNAVVPHIGRTGYVKIDNEFIEYSGVSDDGSNTTLSNLVRGVFESVGAAHTTSDSVYFCVAVDDNRLWLQLYDQMRAFLHELFLTDASQQERGHHERQVSFYQQRADNFWRSYSPGYNPRMMIHSVAAFV